MKNRGTILFSLFIIFSYSLIVTTSAQNKEGTVYVNITGNKYHFQGCKYLSTSKISIEIKKAISRGFYACSVCGVLPVKDRGLPNPEAIKWNDKSFKSLELQNWAEAITTATVAISLDPEFFKPYINRAWAYNEKGLYEKAIADCNKVFEIDPGNAAATNNGAVALFRMGDKEKAIQEYRTACENGLGVACNNLKEAVGYLPSEGVNALLDNSSECFAEGEFEKVIAICSRVINLDPNNVTALTNRCGAQANLGLLKEAKEDCLKSIELNPDNAMAYNHYGSVLEREGNINEAAIYYEMSCGLNNNLGCQNQERLVPSAD